MATETYTIGDTLPWVATFSVEGFPIDLTGCAVDLHIGRGAQCIVAPGAIDAPETGTVTFDLSALDLPPRAYPVAVTIKWSDGSIDTPGGFALNVQERC